MDKAFIGKTIRAVRETLAISQTAFAEALGVDQGSVSRWELGKVAPEAATLGRIAALAKTPVSIFYEPVEAPETLSVAEAVRLRETLRRIVSESTEALAVLEGVLGATSEREGGGRGPVPDEAIARDAVLPPQSGTG